MAKPIHSKSRQTAQRTDKPPTTSLVVGLFLSALALLILLALISYHPADWPMGPVDRPISNWIGGIGAWFAWVLGPMLVGRWAAFGFVVLLGVWGWTLLLRSDWQRPLWITLWVTLLTLWVSTAFGLACSLWPGWTQADYGDIAGLFGLWMTATGSYWLGGTGLAIVLVVLCLAGLTLSVARFAHWFQRGLDSAAESVTNLRVPAVKIPKIKKKIEAAKEPPPEKPSRKKEKRREARKKTASDKAESIPVLPSLAGYVYPSTELFNAPDSDSDITITAEELDENSQLLEESLAQFGVSARVVQVHPGPVITRYDLEPAAGVKVSRIEALADDLALALRARGLRILAPIPGEAAVGIEIANPKPATVTFREIVESDAFQSSTSKLSFALGRMTSGEVFVTDLARMPHLLIAGTTGAGKSVCVNTLIASILLRAAPDEVQFVLIDPKKLELAPYNELRNHHLTHRPDLDEYVLTRPDEAVKALRSVLLEMERRYDLLVEKGSRHIDEYNEEVSQSSEEGVQRLPYLIVVIDELADLMVTAAKEVEEPIARLAQLARAVGIHLVLATQRPSVDVITGVIKANFPARIAFRVAMKVDSRTILDTNGAETLLGRGDMLFQHAEEPNPVRLQGALLTRQEIDRLIAHIRKQPTPQAKLTLPLEPDSEGVQMGILNGDRDPFFLEAAKIVVRTGQGSVSILQRRLKVGYSRAARLIDQLEQAGIVGPFDGSKARAVLVDEHYFDNLAE
ncbi:DNA translocase FtsK [bacterium]|nr:DNA translocase FtsK [bacterium]